MRLLVTAYLLAACVPATAAVKTKTIPYTHDGKNFVGFLAYDDAAKEKRPGVLVVHEWWGLNEYAKNRAEQLAKLGYVAFCPDMYGDGQVTEHPMEARKMAEAVRMNVKAWQARAAKALEILKAQDQVDASRLAAIGYCFGGSTCLQLAYTGADLKAVCTFHAALPTPTADEAKAIKAKVLVCHGADDPFIPKQAIEKFKKALETAGTQLDFESYPNTVHSFTVKEADKKKITGMAYNAEADKKSWQQMQDLFKTALAK